MGISMEQDKKELIKRLERYLFLLKTLKDDSMDKKIEEKYLKSLSIIKEKNNEYSKR